MIVIQAYLSSDWHTIAEFNPNLVNKNIIINCALHIGDEYLSNPKIYHFDDVRVFDDETGEMLWMYSLDVAREEDDCDNDMGYDPYLGCFTDDC